MHAIEFTVEYAQIEQAFRKFYAYMRTSQHFRRFFDSDEQIDSLIQRQAQNFYNSLSMDENTFKDNYTQLGIMHAKLALPIEDMFAALTMIRDTLLSQIEAKHHQEIYQIIEQMDSWLAKGYFIYQIKETKSLVEVSIKSIQKVTPEKHQSYVLRPLNWLSNLLEHYEDPKFLVQDAQDCPLSAIIDDLALETEVRQQMQSAHHEQHTLGASFLFFYQERNYKLVGFILSKLTSLSLALSNQMSYAISQNIIHNLKRDNLTGLLVRHSLKEHYALIKNHVLMQQEGFGVLMMDIDFFKKINDTYGHIAGDKVLKMVAQTISKHARDHDFVFRYGGEEFLMFATHLSSEHLLNIAERIRQAVEKLEFTWEKTQVPITISIGCYWVEPAELDKSLEVLINQADKNLYQAKKGGRNQVVCSGIKSVSG